MRGRGLCKTKQCKLTKNDYARRRRIGKFEKRKDM